MKYEVIDKGTYDEMFCSKCGQLCRIEKAPNLSDTLRETFRGMMGAIGVICMACKGGVLIQDDTERLAGIESWSTEDFRKDPSTALRLCGVLDDDFFRATLANCPDLSPETQTLASKWAENPDGTVFITGGPGGGKTWLAVAVLRKVLMRGKYLPRQAVFTSESRYLDTLKDAMKHGGGEVSLRMLPGRHVRKVQFLVLDDLSATRLTDWGKGELAKLIEDRYSQNLPTIFTSNLTLKEIGSEIDYRAMSRIAATQNIWTFPKGKDLRLVGRYAKKGGAV